jgi:1-aminocyclopropane-1-carboxylate deaminase/D-cysteine desulfhydrase-like pyridoxal-dependent ACC family enzyme
VTLYREHTPIEEHGLSGRRVFVKRDDLYGVPPAPPLAKLRGLRRVLQREYDRGTRLVGCWDTRVSKLGQGVAAACRGYPGMRCLLAFPARSGEDPPPQLVDARALGAALLPLRPNHIDICVGQARREVTARGGVMLPFGLECQEAVDAVAEEALRTPEECTVSGTLVVCCGSGVTLSGLLKALGAGPARVVGISSGRSIERIARCVRRYVRELPATLQLVPASMPYGAVGSAACPFPAHGNYDLKAWQHLQEHIQDYPDPILFWNIGA